MASSDPNTTVVPRASYILAPLSRNDPTYCRGLRGQLRTWCYKIEQAEIFLSILLGDDQTPDKSVTDNERVEGKGVSNCSTDEDTFQPRSQELDSPTTTLWLPKYLERRVATPDYMCVDALKLMKMVLDEVMEFGSRATDVAKVFARLEIVLVEHLLLHLEDLRSALLRIHNDMETQLPLIDPLSPEIVPSDGFVPGASYILEPRPPTGRVGSGALSLVLRYMYNVPKQFDIFLSILRGEDQPPDESATTDHDRGALSHVSLQPHGGEPVTPATTTTVWLPEFLCLKLLVGPFKEAFKFGARATERVAKAIARMGIDHVEYLLAHPEHLRSTLQRLDTIAEDNLETREPGPSSSGISIEATEESFFKLSLSYHFGTSEPDKWPEM